MQAKGGILAWDLGEPQPGGEERRPKKCLGPGGSGDASTEAHEEQGQSRKDQASREDADERRDAFDQGQANQEQVDDNAHEPQSQDWSPVVFAGCHRPVAGGFVHRRKISPYLPSPRTARPESHGRRCACARQTSW
ncbi:MAG: DUF2235 domain-containing protein [Armatimonadetes bacterium]|nr:DUF2235 domain-containing protein [Armatimonadota bacterium]